MFGALGTEMMMFKATEGNGGAPVVVGREPVEGPEILRGSIMLPHTPGLAEDDKITFAAPAEGFMIVYHDIDVIAVRSTGVQVFVGPLDVVTWEKISVAP